MTSAEFSILFRRFSDVECFPSVLVGPICSSCVGNMNEINIAGKICLLLVIAKQWLAPAGKVRQGRFPCMVHLCHGNDITINHYKINVNTGLCVSNLGCSETCSHILKEGNCIFADI